MSRLFNGNAQCNQLRENSNGINGGMPGSNEFGTSMSMNLIFIQSRNGALTMQIENRTIAIQLPVLRWLCLGVSALILASSSAAYSQANNGADASRVPSGSPLSQSQSSSQAIDNQVAQNPFLGGELLAPYSVNSDSRNPQLLEQILSARQQNDLKSSLKVKPAKPGEFEEYVARLLGRKLPRYGEDLLLPSQRDFSLPATATVPPDYIVQPGDRIVIALVGSIDGSVVSEVDSNGRIFLAGVGSIKVAGVRHSDLKDVVSAAIGQQYRGYTVSVNIKQLRGIHVFVTGLANNPGVFNLNSLATVANAIFQAGGPAAGGSFRSIKVYRNGQEVADFDLYQLTRGGSRVNDVVLQNDDVLFIPPAGQQVAVIGSVQEEAIYEARLGESIADMLAVAGGPNTLADRSRVIVYHTDDPDMTGPQMIAMDQTSSSLAKGGDIIQILSTGSLAKPIDHQSVLVRIEGEVNRPGIYYVEPNTPTSEIIAKAGGLTPSAYPYGTKFTRQSVKIQQQESFKEAIRQLELTLASAPLTADSSLSDGQRNSQASGAQAVLERLREARPDGRVVLQLAPTATALPGNILLENNDAIYVPPKASTVGVFGAVFRPASFLVSDGKTLKAKDYLEMAGGTIRAADRANTFVVRANGEVVSRKRGALGSDILAGDVVFVPVKTQGNSFWTKFKDITQTLFQVGVGAATIVAVSK